MWPIANKAIFNIRLKKIRDLEWESIEKHLALYPDGRFLDVGTGTGYALARAKAMGFEVLGCDPDVGGHGVKDAFNPTNRIAQSYAEALPFGGGEFDVVYSSHALEHFLNREKGLKEIQRVLVDDGLAIIAVPTGIMALVNFMSQLIFTSHIRLGRFLVKDRSWINFKRILLPQAHGSYAQSILHEVGDFSINNWKVTLQRYFNLVDIIMPGLYPYPDFPQIFPLIKNSRFSSSAIFLCRKKH